MSDVSSMTQQSVQGVQMWRFVVAAIIVYGTMHIFFYARVRVLFPSSVGYSALLVVFLICMTIAPFAVHLLAHAGWPHTAYALALIGYNWMGFLFLAICGGICLRLINMILSLGRLTTLVSQPPLAGATPVITMLLVVSCLFVYGMMENKTVGVKRLAVHTPKLPAGTPCLKIVQISDVHLGFLSKKPFLDKILNRIKEENPDILVCTGDLLDGHVLGIETLPPVLRDFKPPLGKFAITGNHESYYDRQKAMQYIRDCGFTLLENESVILDRLLNIVGVHDPEMNLPADEQNLLHIADNGLFTLLLKHQPTVASTSLGMFDLQLSGHTHGGQIFPFHLLVGLRFPHLFGLYALPAESYLFTSRGTGTWGPQIRVFAPRHITVIEIQPGKHSLIRDVSANH